MSNSNFTKYGCVMVLSGPSGCGKTSLLKRLISDDPNITQSISYTTREAREGEIDGVDYYFTNQEDFETMLSNDELLEYTEIYGNFYGTPKKAIEKKINSGQDVVFDIDSFGAKAIKSKLPNNTFTIFILPPSHQELTKRLKGRAQDSEDTINKRLNSAREQIQTMHEYDYIIVNDKLDIAYAELKAILTAERLKRSRITNLESLDW